MQTYIDDLGNVGIVVADWDITKPFKARTITTDYTSWICYISRRDVPAGTPITDETYWKPLFRLYSEISFNYEEFKAVVQKALDDIQNQLDGLIEGGISVSNEFGTNTHISISQKTLTDAFTRVWNKIEDITGESFVGIRMTVTPDYFISDTGADVHITAITVENKGIFERIAFYLNEDEEPFFSAENVESVGLDPENPLIVHIDATTLIKCKAKIMGIEYEASKLITKHDSFWLGAGNTYMDVMTEECQKDIVNDMRIAENIEITDDKDRIIVIIGKSLEGGFIRADMNGFEIQMVEQPFTLDDVKYIAYVSREQFVPGEYNIDING